ncbi:CLUMA_CG005790, isoform A [Clunio marinus]|uniref:CLUMA_CG005790, isoform A n=1 Tax=Clunio marinus TaxID=568069 RepID=A0A1J1I1E7_9DIPT|nr:CLUMA_CG005790, isoform A [Clunio marinus]
MALKCLQMFITKEESEKMRGEKFPEKRRNVTDVQNTKLIFLFFCPPLESQRKALKLVCWVTVASHKVYARHHQMYFRANGVFH